MLTDHAGMFADDAANKTPAASLRLDLATTLAQPRRATRSIERAI